MEISTVTTGRDELLLVRVFIANSWSNPDEQELVPTGYLLFAKR